MLQVGTSVTRTCAGYTRRELLQVGGLGVLGLTLADWLRSHDNQASAAGSTSGRRQRELSCIFLWLDGGPSHFETFDPKPNTPDNVRGPYGIIPTRVAGIQISEQMPMVAEHMDKCVILRSMTHNTDAH